MNKTNIGMGFLAAVIGLLMLIAPEQSIEVVVILLGAGAFINGIFILMTTRRLSSVPEFYKSVTIRGWFSIAVGLLAVCLPIIFVKTVTVILTVMLYVLAVYLIIFAGLEIYSVSILRREHQPVKPYTIEIVSALIVAVILFLLPVKTLGTVLVRLFGAAFIAGGLLFAFFEWRSAALVIEPESLFDAAAGASAKSASAAPDPETETNYGKNIPDHKL